MDCVLLAPSSNWYTSQCLSADCSGSLAVYCANTGLVLLQTATHPGTGTGSGTGEYRVALVVHRAHQQRVNAVCLWSNDLSSDVSSSPAQIASVSDDGLVKLWQCCRADSAGCDREGGGDRAEEEASSLNVELIKQHDAHQKPVVSVDVSPVRPSLCVSLDSAGVLVVWDTVAHTTRRLQPLSCPTASAASGSLSVLRCSPHSELLAAAAGKRGLLVTVSLAAGGRLLQKFVGHEAEITAIAWCPQLGNILSFEQDHLLCSVSKENQLRIWGSRTGRCHVTKSLSRSGRRGQSTGVGTGADRGWVCVVWPCFERIYCGMGDGSVQVCSLDSSATSSSATSDLQLQTVHKHHNRSVTSICCPRGTLLLSCGADRQLISHAVSEPDAPDQRLILWRTSSLGGFCYQMQCSPLDPGRLAVACGDNSVRVINLNSSYSDCTVIWQAIKSKVTAVSWHPSRDNCLAYGTETGRVGVCDPCDAAKPGRFAAESHGAVVRDLCWSADGTLYSVSDKHVWKHTGDSLRTQSWLGVGGGRVGGDDEVGGSGCIRLCWGRVDNIPMSAAGMKDGSVLLHDSSGRWRGCGACSSRAVTALQWHPGGSQDRWSGSLAAGTAHGRVLLLRVQADVEQKLCVKTLMTLTGHGGAVADVSWSWHMPELLLSCSADKSVRVWDVSVGSCRTVASLHCRPVRCCLWHPLVAGTVISAGEEASLLLWRADHLDQCHLQIDASTENASSEKNTQKAGATKKKKSKSKSQSSSRIAENQSATGGTQTSNEATLERAKELLDGRRPRSQKCLFPLSVARENRGKTESQRDIDTLLDQLQSSNSGHVTTENAVANTHDDHVTSDVTDQLIHLSLFSSKTESEPVCDLVAAEVAVHDSSGAVYQMAQLSVYRGDIHHVVSRAASRSALTDYLVSLSPMVSYNFWREMCCSYARQLVDANEIIKASTYLTSCHKTEEAIDLLTCHRMYREALTLCRLRRSSNDEKTHSVLSAWAEQLISEGNYELATKCLIKLGDLTRAARLLCCRSDLASLRLAARLFLLSGDTERASSLVCQCVHESCQRGDWSEGVRASMILPQTKQCAALLCVLHETLMKEMTAVTNDHLFSWCVQSLDERCHSDEPRFHDNDGIQKHVDATGRSEYDHFTNKPNFCFTARVWKRWRDGGHFFDGECLAPALGGAAFAAVPTNRKQMWLSVACDLYRSFEVDPARAGHFLIDCKLEALEKCQRLDAASLAALGYLLLPDIRELPSVKTRDIVLRALTVAMLKCQPSTFSHGDNIHSQHQSQTADSSDTVAEAVSGNGAEVVIDSSAEAVPGNGTEAILDSGTMALATTDGEKQNADVQVGLSDGEGTGQDIPTETDADMSRVRVCGVEQNTPNLLTQPPEENSIVPLLECNKTAPSSDPDIEGNQSSKVVGDSQQQEVADFYPADDSDFPEETEASRLHRQSVWIHCAKILIKLVEVLDPPFDEINQLMEVLESCQFERHASDS